MRGALLSSSFLSPGGGGESLTPHRVTCRCGGGRCRDPAPNSPGEARADGRGCRRGEGRGQRSRRRAGGRDGVGCPGWWWWWRVGAFGISAPLLSLRVGDSSRTGPSPSPPLAGEGGFDRVFGFCSKVSGLFFFSSSFFLFSFFCKIQSNRTKRSRGRAVPGGGHCTEPGSV